MPSAPHFPRRPRVRVVLSSTALLPFISARHAAAPAIAQLGVAAFFVSGVALASLGQPAVWFVLAATVLAGIARATDIESWALLLPGGLSGRVNQAFGSRAARVASAVTLAERVTLAALASAVFGRYATAAILTVFADLPFISYRPPDDLATLFASGAIGLLWMAKRTGRDVTRGAIVRAVWIGVAILIPT